MSNSQIDDYTQGLLDRVISLSKTVDNLGIAYQIVRNKIEAMAKLADKTTSDAVKESICAEELARLSFISSQLAEEGASLLGDAHLTQLAHDATQAAKDVYEGTKTSTAINAARQTSCGEIPKK